MKELRVVSPLLSLEAVWELPVGIGLRYQEVTRALRADQTLQYQVVMKAQQVKSHPRYRAAMQGLQMESTHPLLEATMVQLAASILQSLEAEQAQQVEQTLL